MFDTDELSKLTWELFEKSGNVSYYILHNKLQEDVIKEEREKMR